MKDGSWLFLSFLVFFFLIRFFSWSLSPFVSFPFLAILLLRSPFFSPFFSAINVRSLSTGHRSKQSPQRTLEGCSKQSPKRNSRKSKEHVARKAIIDSYSYCCILCTFYSLNIELYEHVTRVCFFPRLPFLQLALRCSRSQWTFFLTSFRFGTLSLSSVDTWYVILSFWCLVCPICHLFRSPRLATPFVSTTWKPSHLVTRSSSREKRFEGELLEDKSKNRR